MAKHRHSYRQTKLPRHILVALVVLGCLIALIVRGSDVALLDPKGLIAQRQAHLMLFVTITLLIIAIPTLAILYFFAWKYRETNSKATYDATISHGPLFTVGLWAIPTLVVVVLTLNMWPAAHQLDPHRAIAAAEKPLTIQVIALRWKWLFIYPEQNIASVNFVQVPVNTPIKFELTADEAPMNSFWIPHWGGQLYAMTGHDNQLNLLANTIGDYNGSAAEINGAGFAGMKFTARAGSDQNFDLWVQYVRQSARTLDTGAYASLLKPSQNNPMAFYSAVQPSLYDTVLAKYGGSHNHHSGY